MTTWEALPDTALKPHVSQEVKREFYSYLDSLTPSQGLSGASISVRVTDAAFEKMLADPEYMQKMKDLCARDICDPNWNKSAAMGIAPSAIVISIDANRDEEYLGSSYNHPSQRDRADGPSFWSRRTKNAESDRKAQAERAAEKREMLHLLQERANERKSQYQEYLSASGGGAVSTPAISPPLFRGESGISAGLGIDTLL